MKIRQGFVSNSSSSSFCIYGTCMSQTKILEIFKKRNYIDENEKEIGYCDIDIIKNSILTIEHGDPENYEDDIYIGRSYTSIKDDETGKQFKESVENALQKIMGEKIKCGICEKAWYDG